jgi:2,3-bisphosphoglycerate-dependent phosphoglycerate mutase
MTIQIVYETHSVTEDNENGIATGWLPGCLSSKGRLLAQDLGERRRNDRIHAVFTSDLQRSIETAEIAFSGTAIPIFHDWRLRECNYGDLNGRPHAVVHKNIRDRLRDPYPRGESWLQAVHRVRGFLDDLFPRWDGSRILVIDHTATRVALEHYLKNVPLQDLIQAEFQWQSGWEYVLARG